jgi:hypothetical protein
MANDISKTGTDSNNLSMTNDISKQALKIRKC